MCASLWFRDIHSIAVVGPHQDHPSESVFAPHSSPFPSPVRLRTRASARVGMTMFACLRHVANATNATAAHTTKAGGATRLNVAGGGSANFSGNCNFNGTDNTFNNKIIF